jgi:hypothetical protein
MQRGQCSITAILGIARLSPHLGQFRKTIGLSFSASPFPTGRERASSYADR